MTAQFWECRDCGFVLRATSGRSAGPKHWDACPDCGGTEFDPVQ
jgi:rubredoxin